MELGLPPWLALDKWSPQVSDAQTSCGYTPESWAGITTAETLPGSALALMPIWVLQLLLALLNRVRHAPGARVELK